MKIITLGLLIGMASGCATKQQPTHIYWTTKSGVAVVHHIVRKVDSIEKLSEKPLDQAEVDAVNLPKGKYFSIVESHADAPVKASPTPKKDAKKDPDGAKLAEVRSELHDLKTQVSRLNEQIADRSPAPQQPPAADSQGIAQETQREAEMPRLSQ